MTTMTATESGTTDLEPRSGLRGIEGIYAAPRPHWVGNGFRVSGYFSAIPDAMRKLDPFLLLDYNAEHPFEPTEEPRGVGVHPHRGFETVTIAFQGSVAHHDSTGAGGVIGPGDVQWMTAARGILHKEYHERAWARRGGTFQMAQLWVNLPRAHKMDAPRYQPITADRMGVVKLARGGEVRVIAGAFDGVSGPAQTHTPITLLDARLAVGDRMDLVTPRADNLGLLVMKGEVTLNGAAAKLHDFVVFDHAGDRVVIEAIAEAQLLVLGGTPIGEPIAPHGPFVMNTRQEIAQAFEDFRSGKFGYLDD